MSDNPAILQAMMEILHERYGPGLDRYPVPPPVFTAMEGEFISFDAAQAVLVARFPVLPQWLNPYGLMQGGMLAAAVDNTLGPLSMLIAPPNVTRRMEIKYSRGAVPEMGHILVEASCVECEGRWLNLRAVVRSPGGDLLARASAVHWILEHGWHPG